MQPKVAVADLPPLVINGRPIPGRQLLEGVRFGLHDLTLVLGESPPGHAARPHRHDHEEILVVHGGRGTYTVGDTTVEAGPGEVVVIPAGVVHSWANRGEEPLYQTAVHGSGRLVLDPPADPQQSSDAT